MKKFLVSAVSFLIGTALAVTGTFAYVSSDVTLFGESSSAVKEGEIVQMSYRRVEGNETPAYEWGGHKLVAITENEDLMPANCTGSTQLNTVSNAIGVQDKFVVVKNVSSTPVYVRTYVAFEAGAMTLSEFKAAVGYHINYTGATTDYYDWDLRFTPITFEGENYFVIAATSKTALEAGGVTPPSLLQFYLKQGTSEAVGRLFGGNYKVLVVSDAYTAQAPAQVDYQEIFTAVQNSNS